MYAEADSAIRTGLAVMNPGSSNRDVTFELVDLNASSTGLKGSVTIAAGAPRALFSPPRRGGVARSAGVVLFKNLVLLNEPPRRSAAPRLGQGGEKSSSCDSMASCNNQTASPNVFLVLPLHGFM